MTNEQLDLGLEAGEALRIRAPFGAGTAAELALGEIVFVDGIIWGLRDATLIRMFDEGVLPPVDLTGAMLLHTAPSIWRSPEGDYTPVSVGTTTSMRMDRFTKGCLKELGARAIVGKGGLSAASARLLRAHGAVYLSIVGGAASTETLQIEAVEEVYFDDLNPECLWKFRVKDFGPLFVSMDATGASLYEQAQAKVIERRSAAERILGI